MAMRDFEFVEPTSVSDACALLAEDPEGSVVFAGGTDLVVDLKGGMRNCRRLVSLARIEAETGRPLPAWIDAARLAQAEDGDLLRLSAGRLIATTSGQQRLDSLLAHLLA